MPNLKKGAMERTGYPLMVGWMSKRYCLESLLFLNDAMEARETLLQQLVEILKNKKLDYGAKLLEADQPFMTFKKTLRRIELTYILPKTAKLEINVSSTARAKMIKMMDKHCPKPQEPKKNPPKRENGKDANKSKGKDAIKSTGKDTKSTEKAAKSTEKDTKKTEKAAKGTKKTGKKSKKGGKDKKTAPGKGTKSGK